MKTAITNINLAPELTNPIGNENIPISEPVGSVKRISLDGLSTFLTTSIRSEVGETLRGYKYGLEVYYNGSDDLRVRAGTVQVITDTGSVIITKSAETQLSGESSLTSFYVTIDDTGAIVTRTNANSYLVHVNDKNITKNGWYYATNERIIAVGYRASATNYVITNLTDNIIYERYVTSNLEIIDIENLDIQRHGKNYKIICSIVRGTVSSGNSSDLYINNDTTTSNYYTVHNLISNDSTPIVIADITAATGTNSIYNYEIYLHLSNNKVMWKSFGTVFGDTILAKGLNYETLYRTSVTNVTRLTFNANASDFFKTGSVIRIFKG